MELAPAVFTTIDHSTKKLVITNCTASNWSDIFKEMHKLKHLRSLSITNCQLKDENIKDLVDNNKHLHSLYLGIALSNPDNNELTNKSL
jgi:hypothetical protein